MAMLIYSIAFHTYYGLSWVDGYSMNSTYSEFRVRAKLILGLKNSNSWIQFIFAWIGRRIPWIEM